MSDLTTSLEIPDYLLPHEINVIKFTATTVDDAATPIRVYDYEHPLASQLPGSIQPMTASEREQWVQKNINATHNIYLSRIPDDGILAGYVLQEMDEPARYFIVQGVFEPGEINVFWTVIALENLGELP